MTGAACDQPTAPRDAVPVGTEGAGPYAVTTGPDGARWVTLIHAGQIARVSLDGTVRVHPLDSPTCQPAQLTVGPDQALWFTLNRAAAVGRIVPGRPGARSPAQPAAIHPLPTPDAGPVGIHAGPTGVWFTEILAARVGHITPNGQISETTLPDRHARPHAVVTDVAGTGCWVTEWGTSLLAHVDPHGGVHEIELPHGSEPHGLTVGPDGALWIALESGYLHRVTTGS